ncbi:MAG: hypothetical protein HYY52_06825 [Candidatus Melainabacteria bacterium]|nr:hypothetical protein [Candidatus Melainabacteria bacterium]
MTTIPGGVTPNPVGGTLRVEKDSGDKIRMSIVLPYDQAGFNSQEEAMRFLSSYFKLNPAQELIDTYSKSVKKYPNGPTLEYYLWCRDYHLQQTEAD